LTLPERSFACNHPVLMNKSTPFPHQHLLGTDTLSADDIRILLDRADYYAKQIQEDRHYRSGLLKGRTVLSLFFEDSTRTRLSFDMDVRTSSVSKGESLTDTVQTIAAGVDPDAIVVRHSEYNAPRFIAGLVDCTVINAGDSYREHPTQALLDAFTLQRKFGKIEGLRVAICGDVAHSRVANSNMILLRKLGAQVHVVAPPYLKPEKFPAEGVMSFDTMKDGLKDCDAVMMLRNQKERMQAGLIDEAQFFRDYGLTYEKLGHAKPGAAVMHPGPMNRGVEIDGDVADDASRSLILEQVRNGIPVRMAVFDLLLNKN
jgi:aspartate carbamoyltransferase catalytic subunit